MWVKLFIVIVAITCVATDSSDESDDIERGFENNEQDDTPIQPPIQPPPYKYYSKNPNAYQIDTLIKAIKSNPHTEEIMHFLSTAGINLAKYFQGDPDAQKKIKSDFELLTHLMKSPMMAQVDDKLKEMGIDLNKLLQFIKEHGQALNINSLQRFGDVEVEVVKEKRRLPNRAVNANARDKISKDFISCLAKLEGGSVIFQDVIKAIQFLQNALKNN